MSIKKVTPHDRILRELDIIKSYCSNVARDLGVYRAMNEYVNKKLDALVDETSSKDAERKKKAAQKKWTKTEGLCARCLQPCSTCNSLPMIRIGKCYYCPKKNAPLRNGGKPMLISKEDRAYMANAITVEPFNIYVCDECWKID